MITLYSRNSALTKLIREACQGQPVGELAIERPAWLQRPRAADYVITKAKLNVRIERFAGSLRAVPVVMPEALPWLIEKLAERQRKTPYKSVIIVGSDYAQPRKGGSEA